LGCTVGNAAPDKIAAYNELAAGEKYLIDPNKS
jgi:hypothetical protein